MRIIMKKHTHRYREKSSGKTIEKRAVRKCVWTFFSSFVGYKCESDTSSHATSGGPCLYPFTLLILKQIVS